jgi:hypothetical protein
LIHGIWSDPSLKDHPIDYLDAEKVGIEVCLLIVVVGSFFRWRYEIRRRKSLGAPRKPYARTSAIPNS